MEWEKDRDLEIMNSAIDLNKKLYLESVGWFLKVAWVSSHHEAESELLLLNI